MSDNKDNKDKKKSNDPFDFFKLSTEPNKSGSDEGKKPRIPFWAMLLIVLVITTIINVFFVYKSDDTIEFSEFRNLIETGQITNVELGQTYFYGFGPETQKTQTPSTSNPLGSMFSQRPSGAHYKTAAIFTQEFITFLDTHDIAYKAQAKQNNVFF